MFFSFLEHHTQRPDFPPQQTIFKRTQLVHSNSLMCVATCRVYYNLPTLWRHYVNTTTGRRSLYRNRCFTRRYTDGVFRKEYQTLWKILFLLL